MGTTLANTTRATAGLLWDACSPMPDPERIRGALAAGPDMALAARAALAQHVAPLLWNGLSHAGATDALGEAGARVRREFDLRRAHASLLLPMAVQSAVEPLMRAGLEPVVFKGPALAARYPDPGLRPMDDIDVLVAPDQHQAALAALERSGWRTWEPTVGHYDVVLHHPGAPGLPLELHRGLDSWRDRWYHLTVADLRGWRQPIDCFGTPAFGLPPEEELVALAAHASKPFHTFRRLIWSADLVVVSATAGPHLDWNRVGRRAREFGCSTALAIALRHARRLGAQVPDDLLELPSSRMRMPALAPLLEDSWPLDPVEPVMIHRLRYALPDATSARLLQVVAEITSAGPRAPLQALNLALLAIRLWWRSRNRGVNSNEGSEGRL
ncbi:MAG: nucleotidyltransferase domain-containing protein [Acidimicrobiales bacterium]